MCDVIHHYHMKMLYKNFILFYFALYSRGVSLNNFIRADFIYSSMKSELEYELDFQIMKMRMILVWW